MIDIFGRPVEIGDLIADTSKDGASVKLNVLGIYIGESAGKDIMFRSKVVGESLYPEEKIISGCMSLEDRLDSMLYDESLYEKKNIISKAYHDYIVNNAIQFTDDTNCKLGGIYLNQRDKLPYVYLGKYTIREDNSVIADNCYLYVAARDYAVNIYSRDNAAKHIDYTKQVKDYLHGKNLLIDLDNFLATAFECFPYGYSKVFYYESLIEIAALNSKLLKYDCYGVGTLRNGIGRPLNFIIINKPLTTEIDMGMVFKLRNNSNTNRLKIKVYDIARDLHELELEIPKV